MAMNPHPTVEQWAALETYILSVPELAALPHYPYNDPVWEHQVISNESAVAIRRYINEKDSNFYVWKTALPLSEIYENGFDWVQVDNLSAGKARIWEWLFSNTTKAINPSKSNVRAGISECWKGTTALVAVRDAVLAHCKTNSVTRAERAMAVGTGSIADPAVFTCRGLVDTPDVRDYIMKSWG
jgi:hypothetical protein